MEEAGVERLIKFIGDYGALFVIAAVFLYAAIRFINLGIKQLESHMSKGDRQKHDKLLDIRTEVSEKIQYLIEVYFADFRGNRIHVIEFSNSVVSVAYLPFRYMTCTYEVHNIDKPATGHNIDRMSTSLFTPFFQKLQTSDYCVIDIDDKTNLVGGAMCDLMKSQNEHRALCAPLHTARGKFIGYIEASKDEKFTETDVEGIKSLAAQISALLSVADH